MTPLSLTDSQKADLADFLFFRCTTTPSASISEVVGFYFAACADAAVSDEPIASSIPVKTGLVRGNGHEQTLIRLAWARKNLVPGERWLDFAARAKAADLYAPVTSEEVVANSLRGMLYREKITVGKAYYNNLNEPVQLRLEAAQ